MARTIFKLFVAAFYQANAGFFLFFFFIFFGTVNGGSLISYHASLLTSLLGSPQILGLVFLFWMLYQIKCLVFIFRIINSEDGSFLYNFQALKAGSQLGIYAGLQLSFYAPVLIYSVVAIAFGFQKGFVASAFSIIAFQLIISSLSAALIYRRLNNWLKPAYTFSFGLKLRKPFLSLLLYHFTADRKLLLAGLKIFSVLMLYIVLVWNTGKADNDSFLLFFLLILLAHFVIPFFSVQFFEKRLSFCRNLPLSRWQYALAYFICYVIILLPELVYLLLYGRSLLPLADILSYYAVAIAGLFLLTAVQYSEAMDRDEYIKIGFALFFVSIFALHVKAFIIWICIQLVIAIILFLNGFWKYETAE